MLCTLPFQPFATFPPLSQMPMRLRLWLPTLLLLVAPIPAHAQQPPFGGTIFLDPDIITASDPTEFTEATFRGTGMRTMFDRRVNNWVQRNAFLVDASFTDGSVVEVQVNPEFGTEAEAMTQAVRWATEVGRLPRALRRDVQTMWIHLGTQPFGGGNNNILIHTGQAQLYINDGILEEKLVHEASHTSLDADWSNHPDWRAAQQSDPTFISTYARDWPDREDIAETFLTWIAVRHRADRISASLKQTIESTIPNRLTFFDRLNLDLQPLSTATRRDHPEPLPDAPFIDTPFPNPSTGSMTIRLASGPAGGARLDIVDVTGKVRRVLADGSPAAGLQTFTWDGNSDAGRPLPSGIYFLRLSAGSTLITRPFVRLAR
jgi:hypothetical protein